MQLALHTTCGGGQIVCGVQVQIVCGVQALHSKTAMSPGRYTQHDLQHKVVAHLVNPGSVAVRRGHVRMCVQLPSRRQILSKLEAEKQALADLKKDPIALDPDAESLARLKALKGEAQRPEKAQVPVRTAQVPTASLTCFCSVTGLVHPVQYRRDGPLPKMSVVLAPQLALHGPCRSHPCLLCAVLYP